MNQNSQYTDRPSGNYGKLSATDVAKPSPVLSRLANCDERLQGQANELLDIAARLDAFADSLLGQQVAAGPEKDPCPRPAHPSAHVERIDCSSHDTGRAIGKLREALARLGI